MVYFKLTSGALSSRAEYVIPSRDMKARKVAISYKHDTEDGSWKRTIVERPVRQVVKHCDIEDTSLLDDITAVRNAAKKVIDDRRIVPENRIKEAIRPEEIITTKESEDDTIDGLLPPQVHRVARPGEDDWKDALVGKEVECEAPATGAIVTLPAGSTGFTCFCTFCRYFLGLE